MESIPVVDFCSLAYGKDSRKSTDLDQLSRKLIDAFRTVGFVYILNHGISQNQIDDIHALGKELFSLPLETKMKYPLKERNGYIRVGQESINPERHGDLKECFNVRPYCPKAMFPKEVDNSKNRIMDFYQACWKLSQRILLVIAHGLCLPENVFEMSHTFEKPTNRTMLRFLHYPPLPTTMKPNQIRLGEHSDYGTITLLFQDDVGGLEVKHQSGEWVPATPVPGANLINIGDLLQRWSSDKLKSTTHRIRIQEQDFRKKSSRFSVAYFVSPNDDFLVECLDDSNKYPPVLVRDFVMQRLEGVYK